MSDNKKEYRDKSYVQERCEEGLIFKTWTQTWGVKIKPVYDMDKIRFEFHEKFTEEMKKNNIKGKHFNVDVPCKKDNVFDFMNFAEEVLTTPDKPYKHSFIKVLAQEKAAGERFPKRYKWRTGDNGEKSVGFTNSSSGGYLINGSNTALGISVNIPLCDTAVEDICAEFLETYEERMNVLRTIRSQGIENVANYFKTHKNELDKDTLQVEGNLLQGNEVTESTDEIKADTTPMDDTNASTTSVEEITTTVEKPATKEPAAKRMKLFTSSPVKVREDNNYEFTFHTVNQEDNTPKTEKEYTAIVDATHFKGDSTSFAKFMKKSMEMSTLVEVDYTYETIDGVNVCYVINIAA